MTSSRSLRADRADLVRALGTFAEPPTDGQAAVASALGLGVATAAEYTELFVHQLVPYGSVYLGPEGAIGGIARDSIAGFWRAIGLTPPAEPDHLTSLLGLWASLVEAPRADADATLAEHAVHVLVWEHVASWLTPFLARTVELAPEPYVAWAETLQAVVEESVASAGPADLPAHFREPLGPPEDAGDFVPFLLTPARSGLVLTRHDVARAAGDLGLGMRIGERAYALRALVDQDAAAVVGWLSAEADRQAGVLEIDDALGPVRAWWVSRLQRTGEVLARGYGGRR